MRKLILLIIILLIGIGLFAQISTQRVVNIRITSASAVGVSPADTFNVVATVKTDQLGQGYNGSQIDTADILVDQLGRQFEVYSITTQSPGSITFRVFELQPAHIAPFGNGIVQAPTGNDLRLLVPDNDNGITGALYARIVNHNTNRLDSLISEQTAAIVEALEDANAYTDSEIAALPAVSVGENQMAFGDASGNLISSKDLTTDGSSITVGDELDDLDYTGVYENGVVSVNEDAFSYKSTGLNPDGISAVRSSTSPGPNFTLEYTQIPGAPSTNSASMLFRRRGRVSYPSGSLVDLSAGNILGSIDFYGGLSGGGSSRAASIDFITTGTAGAADFGADMRVFGNANFAGSEVLKLNTYTGLFTLPKYDNTRAFSSSWRGLVVVDDDGNFEIADTTGLFGGGGSGSTEQADGVTILGDGTGGDPFAVDTTLLATTQAVIDSIAGLAFGDVTGPGSSTDNAIARFDGTGGKTLQNSTYTISDAGVLEIGNTTFTSQTGVVNKGGTRFLHNFNYGNNGTVTTNGNNIFLGINAGNFTAGSTATLSTHASNNIGIGTTALTSVTTGGANVGIGHIALASNTTGQHNVAIGSEALGTSTTAAGNVAIGYRALSDATTGSNNMAQGRESMRFLTTGQFNAGLGYRSLYALTTGSNNAGIGNQVLSATTTSSNNTALGSFAGSNATSSNSIYLGYGTQSAASGQTNEVVIGYSATGQGSNTTVIGNTSTTLAYIEGILRLPDSEIQLDATGAYKIKRGTGSPESVETASPGSLFLSTGGTYTKDAGTGSIGWEQLAQIATAGTAGKIAVWTDNESLEPGTLDASAITWIKPELEAGNDVNVDATGASLNVNNADQVELEASSGGVYAKITNTPGSSIIEALDGSNASQISAIGNEVSAIASDGINTGIFGVFPTAIGLDASTIQSDGIRILMPAMDTVTLGNLNFLTEQDTTGKQNYVLKKVGELIQLEPELSGETNLAPANSSTIALNTHTEFIYITDTSGGTQTQTFDISAMPQRGRVVIKTDEGITSVTFTTATGNIILKDSETGSSLVMGPGEVTELMLISTTLFQLY